MNLSRWGTEEAVFRSHVMLLKTGYLVLESPSKSKGPSAGTLEPSYKKKTRDTEPDSGVEPST